MAKKSGSIIATIFRNALLICNVATAIWLILCYASSTVHPASIKYIALFSLTIPFALLANFVFFFIWLFSSRKWLTLVSLLPLAFCWEMIPAVFGIHYFSRNDWDRTNQSFKVMTWNVHAMGIFNTPYEKEYAKGIIELIGEEQPDILCLPEFAVNADLKKRVYPDRILKAGGYKVYQFNMDNGYGPNILLGTAFFSRYPIVRYMAHELSPYIYLIEADVNINGSVVRVGVMHLQSFGLSDEDKAVIEDVKEERNQKSIAKSRSFAWKFNEAYIRRANEADKAHAILSQSPYPVIACGDFNDLPFSYTYRTIKGQLNDAFTDKGRWFGRTYNQIIPTLRIDHIFYNSNGLAIKAFKTRYSGFSDHSPVIANFEIISEPRD